MRHTFLKQNGEPRSKATQTYLIYFHKVTKAKTDSIANKTEINRNS